MSREEEIRQELFDHTLNGHAPEVKALTEEALKLGWAHGALLTTYPGDTTMATLEQVKSFAQGGSARIQR